MIRQEMVTLLALFPLMMVIVMPLMVYVLLRALATYRKAMTRETFWKLWAAATFGLMIVQSFAYYHVARGFL